MACNMRCKHCGSLCSTALPGELTTLEGFKFIDMCKDIGLRWISLSGGEPFCRRDILLLLKYLYRCKIPANIISNGWLVSEDIVKELSFIRPLRVMISIDGPKNIHDSIRKSGSFERAMGSFKLFKKYGVMCGCITTLTKANVDYLEDVYRSLLDAGVQCWQFQLGMPMGNLAKNKEMLLYPEDLPRVIDYFYKKSLEDRIEIYPTDCIGYYNEKVDEMLKKVYRLDFAPRFTGCNAGKHGFGLLHNGDVIGCTSIRDREYIEGNIKEKSLRDIWEDPNSFAWNRKFSRSHLRGECANCEHADECLGGCADVRLTTKGSFDSENEYCTYNLFLKGRHYN